MIRTNVRTLQQQRHLHSSDHDDVVNRPLVQEAPISKKKTAAKITSHPADDNGSIVCIYSCSVSAEGTSKAATHKKSTSIIIHHVSPIPPKNISKPLPKVHNPLQIEPPEIAPHYAFLRYSSRHTHFPHYNSRQRWSARHA